MLLKWADVDLANGTARVRKSGVRPVYLTESAKRALAQLERQGGNARHVRLARHQSEEQQEWGRWFQKCVRRPGSRIFIFMT